MESFRKKNQFFYELGKKRERDLIPIIEQQNLLTRFCALHVTVNIFLMLYQ